MSEQDDESETASRWSLLGLGGVASLCCVFAVPSGTAALGGAAAAGGTTAALGGGLIRITVAALAVGFIVVALRLRG
ncbi:hypothetical protein [Natronomonas sp.]|uniref:hypothetical protein n=1 Tax=Natronomonas sp. TaxID=2184060 RepID=UPI002FC3C834